MASDPQKPPPSWLLDGGVEAESAPPKSSSKGTKPPPDWLQEKSQQPPFASAPSPQQPPVLGGGGGAAPTGSGMQSAPSQPPIAPGGITNVTERLRFTSGEDEMGDAVLMSPVKTGLIRSPEQKAMMSAHDKFDGFDLPKIAKYREEKIAVGKQQLRGIKLVAETDAKQLEESANTLEKMKAEVEVSPTPEAVAAYNAAVSRHNSDVNLFTKQQQALQDAAMSLDVEQNELFRREYDIKSKQGSFVGATRNELLAGVGDLLGGLETAIAFGVVSQLPVGAEGVLGGKSGERDQLFKDIRRRVIGPMSNVPGEELGDKGTTPEYSEEMRKEFLGGAWLGLARSAPAMATPYMSGIALQTMKSTMEEMDAPEFADISEAEKFAISVPIGAVSAALERFGFKNLASNKAVVKTVLANGLRKLSAEAGVEEISRVMNMEARNFATRYVAAAATGAAAEFETGAIQELSTNAIKEAYNAARDGERFRTPDGWMEYLGETFKAGAQEAVGGFIMAQPFAVSQAMRKGEVGKVATPKQFEVVEELAVDPNYDAMFKEQQAQDVEDGKLTKEQAEQVTQDWETAKRIIEKTPDDLPVGSRMKAFDILSQMEGLRKKEPALVANKMEALKQQLQALEGVPETPEATVDAEGKKGEEPPPVQPTGEEVQRQSLISAEGAVTPEAVTGFQAALDASKKSRSYGEVSDWVLSNSRVGDEYLDDRGDGYRVTNVRTRADGTREVEMEQFEILPDGSREVNNAGLLVISDKSPSRVAQIMGTSYTDKDGNRKTSDYSLRRSGASPTETVVQPTVVEDVSTDVRLQPEEPAVGSAGAPTVDTGGVPEIPAEAPPVPSQAPPSVPVQERPVSDLYVKPDLSRDVADDPVALASAYMDDHITHSDGSTLDDHIGTLVGNNVNRASFEKFGDVSNITKDMKRAYLREEGGRELDDLAEELTGIWGETVTPEQIVDYIIRNPTGRQAVSPRAREIASRYYGITGKRMNSLTAKMILGMNKDDDGNPIPAKRVKWKPAEQAIVDAALAAQVDLSEINDDDIADAKNMEDDDLMDMFGPSRKGKTTTATEDKRKKDEEAKQAQPAGADGTGGEVRRAESPRPPRAADPEEERLAEALKTARAERDRFVNDFNDRGQGLFAPADIPTRQQTIDDTIDNSKENFDAKVEPLNERVRQAAKALADYVEKGADRAAAAAKQTSIEAASIADRIEQAADELEKKLRGMAGSFPVPPTIIVSAMRAAAKVIRAGESLAKAIRAAIDDMQASRWWKALSPSDQGKAEREVREQLRVALEPREPKAPKPSEVKKQAEEGTVKTESKKITVNEMSALKDQIRLEARAAREAKGDVRTKQKAFAESVKTMLAGLEGSLTEARSRSLITAAVSVDPSKPLQVERFIASLETAIARSAESGYMKELHKAIDLSNPANYKTRRPSGVVVGKIEASRIKMLERIHTLIKAGNLDDIFERIAGIDDSLIDGAMPVEEVENELEALRIAAGALSGEIDGAKAAQEAIRMIVAEGRSSLREVLKDKADMYAKMKANAVQAVTGGKGVKSQFERAAIEKEAEGFLRSVVGNIHQFLDSAEGLRTLLDKMDIGKRQKDNPYGSTLDRSIYEPISDALNRDSKLNREAIDMLHAKLVEIYGSKRNVVKAQRKNTHQEDVGAFTNLNGDKVDVKLSQNQAYYLYNLAKNPDNIETFRAMGWTDEMMDAVTNFLDPKVKEWADWQTEKFYPEMYKKVNKVYKRMNYLDLPQVEQYTPIRREGKKSQPGEATVNLENGAKSVQAAFGITPGALKERVGSTAPFDITIDGDALLLQHMSKMNHYVAYAEAIKGIAAIVGDSQFREGVRQNNNKGTLSALDGFVKDIAQQGVNRDKAFSAIEKLNGRMATSTLAISPVLTLKQMTAFPAYMSEMPIKDFVRGVGEFALKPMQAHKDLMESEYLKERFRKGFDRDVAIAMAKDYKKTFSKSGTIMEKLMWNVKYGDMGAILMGGYANYKYHYRQAKKQGFSEAGAKQYAIRRFEEATKLSQQSTGIPDLSHFQRGNGLAKMATLYMTQPMSYFRQERKAFRDMYRGIKSKDPVRIADATKRFIIYHVFLPALFQYVSNGLPGLIADWDDDDEEDMIRAMTLGSLNGVFLIGNTFAYMADRLQKKPWANDGPDYIPAFKPVSELGKAIVDVLDKWLIDENAQDEDVLEALSDLSFASLDFAGYPASRVQKLYGNYEKVVQQWNALTPEQVALLMAGYNEYTVGTRETSSGSSRSRGTERSGRPGRPSR